MRTLAAVLLGVFSVLAGCAAPGAVQLSPDTYLITRTDKAGIFGNPSEMKVDVISDANSFAASKNKVVIPVSIREMPLIVGQRFASIEYQFRVVNADDPEVKRTALTPRPDLVIERIDKVSVKTKDETVRPRDVYAELIKLDDLRKRGILTDAEFEVQKQKVLTGKFP